MPDFHIRDASRLSLLTWKKRVTYIASDDLHPRRVQLGCVTDDLQPRRVQLGRVTDDPSAVTRPDKTHHWCGSQQRRILAKRFTNDNLQKRKKGKSLLWSFMHYTCFIHFSNQILYKHQIQLKLQSINFSNQILYKHQIQLKLQSICSKNCSLEDF